MHSYGIDEKWKLAKLTLLTTCNGEDKNEKEIINSFGKGKKFMRPYAEL